MIPGTTASRRYRIPSKVEGHLSLVEWAGWRKPSRLPKRGPKRDGVMFEREVSKVMATVQPPWFYAPGPWIRYEEDGILRHAQPDGLLINFRSGVVICIEMKLRHTRKAEVQMLGKYQPLLRELFPQPDWRLHFCEIYKIWDFVDCNLTRVDDFSRWWVGGACMPWGGALPRGLA